MKQLSPKERLKATLSLQEVDRIPVAQPLQTGTVELMESCGAFWPDAHRDADKMARLSYEAHAVVGFESVRVPFDINVESEALGCVLDYTKGRGKGIDIQPSIKEISVPNKEDLGKVQVPDPRKSGRMPVVIEAVRLLRQKVGDEIPVIAAVVAPFMIAGQIRSVDLFMRDLVKDPGFAHDLLDKCYQTCLTYAQALVEAGADVITLIDATASPDLVSPKYFGDFAKAYSKKVAVQLGVPTILHICGKTEAILDQMAEIANGVSVDSSVDMSEVKRVLGRRAAAAGNIDVNTTLLFGSKEEIEASVKTCIEKGTNLLTTGCGIGPRTPTENLITMVNAGKKYWIKQ